MVMLLHIQPRSAARPAFWAETGPGQVQRPRVTKLRGMGHETPQAVQSNLAQLSADRRIGNVRLTSISTGTRLPDGR